MGFQNRIVLVVVLLNFISNLYILGNCKVLLTRWETCDDTENYKLTFKFTFKTVGDKQYANCTFLFTTPVDNNLKTNFSVDMRAGNQYVHLFSVTEKRSCDALNKYFGEFWYDMERHAGIIPGLCPIEKGRYHLHNYLLNWDKMTTLSNFPLGNLRITAIVYDSKNTIVTYFLIEGTIQA